MKVFDLPRGMRIAVLQGEQGTIMTRLVYKDRNKQSPGSKPGSKPNSKLDKRTSDAMDDIEGPAEREGGAATDQEHPPVEEPKDRATKSGRLKLPPAEDPLKQDDPPAPEGDKGHVS